MVEVLGDLCLPPPPKVTGCKGLRDKEGVAIINEGIGGSNPRSGAIAITVSQGPAESRV